MCEYWVQWCLWRGNNPCQRWNDHQSWEIPWNQLWWIIFERIPVSYSWRTHPSELQGKKEHTPFVNRWSQWETRGAFSIITQENPKCRECSLCSCSTVAVFGQSAAADVLPACKMRSEFGFMMQPTDSSVKVAVQRGLKPWKFMMKIGKTGNTLNDTQQIYVIVTYHLGEVTKAAQILRSHHLSTPIWRFWRGDKQADWGGGTAKIERGLFDQWWRHNVVGSVDSLKLHSRRHVVLKYICLRTWFQHWGKEKRCFVPLIEFILVHFTCTVVNHNMYVTYRPYRGK